MARGYPDFFGFSMFPFYGTTLFSGHIVNSVIPGVEKSMFELNYKGRIVGGRIAMYTLATSGSARLRVYIDDVMIFDETPGGAFTFGNVHPGTSPAFLSVHYLEFGTYTYVFSPDYTFGRKWECKIKNDDIVNINYDLDVIYNTYKG